MKEASFFSKKTRSLSQQWLRFRWQKLLSPEQRRQIEAERLARSKQANIQKFNKRLRELSADQRFFIPENALEVLPSGTTDRLLTAAVYEIRRLEYALAMDNPDITNEEVLQLEQEGKSAHYRHKAEIAEQARAKLQET